MLQAKRGEGRVCSRRKGGRDGYATGQSPHAPPAHAQALAAARRAGREGLTRAALAAARSVGSSGVNQRIEICASNRNMCAIVTCVLLPQQSTLLCGRQTCMRIEISLFLTRIKMQILKYAGL